MASDDPSGESPDVVISTGVQDDTGPGNTAVLNSFKALVEGIAAALAPAQAVIASAFKPAIAVIEGTTKAAKGLGAALDGAVKAEKPTAQIKRFQAAMQEFLKLDFNKHINLEEMLKGISPDMDAIFRGVYTKATKGAVGKELINGFQTLFQSIGDDLSKALSAGAKKSTGPTRAAMAGLAAELIRPIKGSVADGTDEGRAAQIASVTNPEKIRQAYQLLSQFKKEELDRQKAILAAKKEEESVDQIRISLAEKSDMVTRQELSLAKETGKQFQAVAYTKEMLEHLGRQDLEALQQEVKERQKIVRLVEEEVYATSTLEQKRKAIVDMVLREAGQRKKLGDKYDESAITAAIKLVRQWEGEELNATRITLQAAIEKNAVELLAVEKVAAAKKKSSNASVSAANDEMKSYHKALNSYKEMTKAAEQHFNSVRRVSQVINQISSQMRIMGGIGVGVFTGFLASTVELANSMRVLSEETGVSLEGAQKMIAVFGQYGSSAEQATRSLKILAKSVDDAQEKVGTARDRFSRLGISMKDLTATGGDLWETFKLISEKVSTIEDPTRRAAVATQLFGKGAVALIPAIVAGKSALEAMFNKAPALTEGQAKKMLELSIEISNVTTRLRLLGVDIITAAKPAIETLVAVFEKFASFVKTIPTGLIGFAASFVLIGGAVSIVVSYLAQAVNAFRELSATMALMTVKGRETAAAAQLSAAMIQKAKMDEAFAHAAAAQAAVTGSEETVLAMEAEATAASVLVDKLEADAIAARASWTSILGPLALIASGLVAIGLIAHATGASMDSAAKSSAKEYMKLKDAIDAAKTAAKNAVEDPSDGNIVALQAQKTKLNTEEKKAAQDLLKLQTELNNAIKEKKKLNDARAANAAAGGIPLDDVAAFDKVNSHISGLKEKMDVLGQSMRKYRQESKAIDDALPALKQEAQLKNDAIETSRQYKEAMDQEKASFKSRIAAGEDLKRADFDRARAQALLGIQAQAMNPKEAALAFAKANAEINSLETASLKANEKRTKDNVKNFLEALENKRKTHADINAKEWADAESYIKKEVASREYLHSKTARVSYKGTVSEPSMQAEMLNKLKQQKDAYDNQELANHMATVKAMFKTELIEGKVTSEKQFEEFKSKETMYINATYATASKRVAMLAKLDLEIAEMHKKHNAGMLDMDLAEIREEEDARKLALARQKALSAQELEVERGMVMGEFAMKENAISNEVAMERISDGEAKRRIFELSQLKHDAQMKLDAEQEATRKKESDAELAINQASINQQRMMRDRNNARADAIDRGSPERYKNEREKKIRDANAADAAMTAAETAMITEKTNAIKASDDAVIKSAQNRAMKIKQAYEYQHAAVTEYESALRQLHQFEKSESGSDIERAESSILVQIDNYQKLIKSIKEKTDALVEGADKEKAIAEEQKDQIMAQDALYKGMFKTISDGFKTTFDHMFNFLKDMGALTSENLTSMQDDIEKQLVNLKNALGSNFASNPEAEKLLSIYKEISTELEKLTKKSGDYFKQFSPGGLSNTKDIKGYGSGGASDFMSGMGGGTSWSDKLKEKLGPLDGMTKSLTGMVKQFTGSQGLAEYTSKLSSKFVNLGSVLDEVVRKFREVVGTSMTVPNMTRGTGVGNPVMTDVPTGATFYPKEAWGSKRPTTHSNNQGGAQSAGVGDTVQNIFNLDTQHFMSDEKVRHSFTQIANKAVFVTQSSINPLGLLLG